MSEDAQAQYRRDQQAGQRAALARWKALAGNDAAAAALRAATEALLPDEGWDPVEYVSESERAANG